jgi:hypothetical protein
MKLTIKQIKNEIIVIKNKIKQKKYMSFLHPLLFPQAVHKTVIIVKKLIPIKNP